MLNVNTTLTHGEHKVSVYGMSLIAGTANSTPFFVLELVTKAGETVTISTPIHNGFDLYHVQTVLNGLIGALNDSLPDDLHDLPRFKFVSFRELVYDLTMLESMLKDFEATITVNLTGNKIEPLQVKAIELA